MQPVSLPPVKKKVKTRNASFIRDNFQGGRDSSPDIRHVTALQWEACKQRKIRDNFVVMGRKDTAHARNSFLHNMAIELLIAGHHKTFEEILVLVEQRKTEILKAGVDSVLWERPTLEVETEKLEMLRKNLTKAEIASRAGNWEIVYSCRHQLANYFLQCEDFKLADYFYESALEISFNIRMDGRKREAEALYYMGLVCERHGDVEGASKYMDECYMLSVGRHWTNNEGVLLGLSSCLHLSRLCNTLAERCNDPSDAFPLLKRSLEIAKEGEDRLEIAQAALKLGICYQETNDHRTAVQFLTESFNTARAVDEKALLGRACEALSRSLFEQGEIEKCLEYLCLYTETYHSHADRQEFINACISLGILYNVIGDYDLAIEYFGAAYDESNVINQKHQSAQVFLGIARGNAMMPSYSKNLDVEAETITMPRIIAWKDKRESQFDDPLPLYLTSTSFRNMPSDSTFFKQYWKHDPKKKRASISWPEARRDEEEKSPQLDTRFGSI